MALMRSDQCPCWADYTKVNSEHNNMNSVLLWVLLASCCWLFFTSNPDGGSWTRIWQEQQQKLFSFHHAPCIPSMLRGWEDEANQLRVPSRGGWPRGIMTAPSPGKSSTQERDICSRMVGAFLLKTHPFTLGGFGLYFSCVVREAPQMPWERGWSWNKPVPQQCNPFLDCLRGAFQKENFWWIMVHQLGLSFVAWPSILVWARAEHLSPLIFVLFCLGGFIPHLSFFIC